MNNAQINAVRATDGLAGTLHRMNETVSNALIDINATAVRVNQAIGSCSIYSNFLSLPSATVIGCEDINTSPFLVVTDSWLGKQTSLLRAVISTAIRLLWFILQRLPPFLAMVGYLFQVSFCTRIIPWQPYIVAMPVVSVLRWFLRKILAGPGFGYSRPCVFQDFKLRSESSQTLAAPTSSVTLAARATPWSYGRRPSGRRRSPQFSRIPDRLCGRRLND